MRTIGRYTHRVGISNARLRSMDARGVTFATKPGREITLAGEAFLRRFMEHVPPKGFTRIRHDGLLAARHATTTLERARALLTTTSSVAPAAAAANPAVLQRPLDVAGARCEGERSRSLELRALRDGAPRESAARAARAPRGV